MIVGLYRTTNVCEILWKRRKRRLTHSATMESLPRYEDFRIGESTENRVQWNSRHNKAMQREVAASRACLVICLHDHRHRDTVIALTFGRCSEQD